jgi:hypothetical protein
MRTSIAMTSRPASASSSWIFHSNERSVVQESARRITQGTTRRTG